MQSKLIIGIVVAVLFSLYSAALITYGYERSNREHAEQDKKDLEAAISHRDALQAQIDNMAGENAELVMRLRNQPTEIHKHETDAQKSDLCNATIGAVRLLNVRRGYPLGSPENPVVATAEDAETSTITGARIQRELEICEADYSLAIARLNGLIDSCSVLQ